MFTFRTFIGIGLAVLAQNTLAAGFDCSSQGLNQTEKTVCENNYLSGLDNVMNGFFTTAQDNSYALGTLSRDQRKWLAERNRCGSDVECIKAQYIERNKVLARVGTYQKVSDVFVRPDDKLDAPMTSAMKNKAGFTMTEEPWRVRKLTSSDELAAVIDSANASGYYLRLLTHRIINNDLIVFIGVHIDKDSKRTSYVIRLKDGEKPKVMAAYSGYNLDISLQDNTRAPEGDVLFTVAEYSGYGANVNQDSEYAKPRYFALKVTAKALGDVVETAAPAASSVPEKWIGYCGSKECSSRVASPDGQWRLASADRNIDEVDEGMYYFPADRPDAGVNVFMPQADTAKGSDYSYDRNYVWGKGPIFFFDNEGGYACIWKTDITQKTTKRILPVEAFVKPHYVEYRGEEMVIASYSYYSSSGDFNLEELYISKL